MDNHPNSKSQENTREKTRPHGRRRNFKHRSRNFGRQDFSVCPICGKAVRSVLTAISVNETMDPAHFDCVLKELTEKEVPGPGEKVSYLGNGTFAVIKMRPGRAGAHSFTIIKKIQYEQKDTKAEWRKKISRRLKK